MTSDWSGISSGNLLKEIIVNPHLEPNVTCHCHARRLALRAGNEVE